MADTRPPGSAGNKAQVARLPALICRLNTAPSKTPGRSSVTETASSTISMGRGKKPPRTAKTIPKKEGKCSSYSCQHRATLVGESPRLRERTENPESGPGSCFLTNMYKQFNEGRTNSSVNGARATRLPQATPPQTQTNPFT